MDAESTGSEGGSGRSGWSKEGASGEGEFGAVSTETGSPEVGEGAAAAAGLEIVFVAGCLGRVGAGVEGDWL